MVRLWGWTSFVLTASFALGQGGFEGPGRYEIANLKSGKVLDLDRNDQTRVIQYSSRGTDNQRWDIEAAGSGFFYIRNGMNGKALQPSGDSNSAPIICARFDRSPNQEWRIEPGKDGNAMIVSRQGRTVDVPDGSSRDGLRLQIYDPNGDSNQRSILQRVGRGPDPDRGEDRDRGRPLFDRGDRNTRPDPSGRYWDEREQMWKLAGDGVCFYQGTDFRGNAFWTRRGSDIGDGSRDFSFLSAKLFGR